MKPLVIFASSRSDGNSMRLVRRVIGENEVEFIDLREQDISYYDYESKNSGDDFLAIAEKMTRAEVIIFVTPVYWYSMSGILKVFFDRFTDLITIHKALGRALAGRKCFLVASGADIELPPGFEEPFSATCNYLNMEYKGCLYSSSTTAIDEKAITEFRKGIF